MSVFAQIFGGVNRFLIHVVIVASNLLRDQCAPRETTRWGGPPWLLACFFNRKSKPHQTISWCAALACIFRNVPPSPISTRMSRQSASTLLSGSGGGFGKGCRGYLSA